MSRRKQYDSQFKAQVALEAIKNQRTLAQIASEYGVHPNLFHFRSRPFSPLFIGKAVVTVYMSSDQSSSF